jgi:hypothetical protein
MGADQLELASIRSGNNTIWPPRTLFLRKFTLPNHFLSSKFLPQSSVIFQSQHQAEEFIIYFIALPSTSIRTSVKNNTVNKLARMSKTRFCRVRSHFEVLANGEWLAAGKWFRLPSLHDFDVRVCVCLLILAALM